MARGWESKDVESQLESAEAARRSVKQRKSPEELEIDRRRESLELSRRRVLHDLDTARHPRHREQLEKSLAFLDQELKKLGDRTQ
jgi:hypothetical protein